MRPAKPLSDNTLPKGWTQEDVELVYAICVAIPNSKKPDDIFLRCMVGKVERKC